MSDVSVSARIFHTAGVAGGSARIGDTRIPVWLVVHWNRAGWSAERICDEYPGLEPADVEAALAYAQQHREEIERDLAEQDDEASG
jgi:uncharacterized protein (DUF433 family)